MTLEKRAWRRSRLTLLAILALAVAGLFLPSPSSAAFPGANGRIAYDSNQGGTDLEIMSGAQDGSGSTQLTNNTVDDKQPAWSPDGSKIAYAHFNTTTSHFEIWTMNADGSGQAALVTAAVDLTSPTWSRTGSKVAFVYKASATNDDIYRADTSGLNVNVTPIAFTAANERDPSYSPTVDRIAYDRSNAGHFELVTVLDTNQQLTNVLTDASHDLTQPNWSPDGLFLVYQYQATATNDDVYTVHWTGGPTTPVVATAANERSPVFSPDLRANANGQLTTNLVAYQRVETDAEIYAANVDGSGTTPIETRATTTDGNPDWQPVTNAQVRARGASPFRLPLVPAFKQCIGGNVSHPAPFNITACAPPHQTSNRLTVGDPLVNGKAANFLGSVLLRSISGDGQVTVSLTDVRCAVIIPGNCTGGLLSDFTGPLRVDYHIRITDRQITGGKADTIGDYPYAFTLTCATTADTTVGSTCSRTTTFNALTPGAIVAGNRASWELLDLTVSDANTLEVFARPGSFYP